MTPKLVTFDAADTLIRVRWQPGPFAVSCAKEAGVELDEQPAREKYDRLLRSRWTEYCKVNQTRNADLCDAFWRELAKDWLDSQNVAPHYLEPLLGIARENLYACFELFPGVLEAVHTLKRKGIPVAVISNWDYSLHRIMKRLDVHHVFDAVVASLEEGPEKPDPRLFQLVLDKFGVEAAEAVHVGDNPLDDLEGARNAGMKALLIDRSRPEASPPIISSLDQLDAAIEWLS